MRLLSTWRSGLVAMFVVFTLTACTRSPEDLYERAQEAAAAGDPNAAVVDLKNALQERPNYGPARRLLGEQYLRLGDAASAAKELQRALELGEPERVLRPLLMRAELDGGNAAGVLARMNKLNAADLDSTLWALRGEALLESKDLAAARDAFATALRLDPKNADAYLGLARLAWNAGDAAAAEKAFETALQIAPGNVRGQLSKGEFALTRRQFPAATQAFKAALESGRGYFKVRAKIGLARVYIFTGDKVNAQKTVDQILKQAPELPVGHYLAALLAHQKGEFARAEEQVAIVLARAPDHLPSIFLKGVISAAQEHWLQAEEDLSRVVALVPNDLQSRKMLANVHMRQGHVDKAIATLEEVQALGVDDAEFQSLLGSAYMRAGDTTKGMEAMERAAKLAPTKPEFRTQAALGHLALGDSAMATEQLRTAAAQSKDDLRSDLLLVMVLLRDRKFDEALVEAQRLIKENPRDPVRYNLAAAALLGKRDEARATQMLREALKIDPKNGPAKQNLALMAERRGDIDGAYRLYHEAFTDDKTNYRALTALVQLEVRRNRTPQALALLERVRAEQPRALEPRSLLIGLHSRTGSYAAALQVVTEALKIEPRNPLVRLAQGRALLALQRNDEAVTALDALARDTSYTGPEILHELSRARMATGNLPEARRVLDLALQQSARKHVPSLTMAAVVALQQKRNADARGLIEELRKALGDVPNVQELTGDLALAERRAAAAVAPYRAALQGAPSSALIGKLSAALAQSGKPAEAVTELQAWTTRYPRDIGARMQLADLYLNTGQLPQAQAAYEAVIQAMPGNAFALNNLAWIYLQRGDRRASAVAEKALKLMPENPEVIDTAAWMRFKSGTKQGVLAMLRKAAARSSNPEIRYHLAEVLASDGDKAGAKAELDRILAAGAPQFTSRPAAVALRARL